jgi:hypothetical protein
MTPWRQTARPNATIDLLALTWAVDALLSFYSPPIGATLFTETTTLSFGSSACSPLSVFLSTCPSSTSDGLPCECEFPFAVLKII